MFRIRIRCSSGRLNVVYLAKKLLALIQSNNRVLRVCFNACVLDVFCFGQIQIASAELMLVIVDELSLHLLVTTVCMHISVDFRFSVHVWSTRALDGSHGCLLKFAVLPNEKWVVVTENAGPVVDKTLLRGVDSSDSEPEGGTVKQMLRPHPRRAVSAMQLMRLKVILYRTICATVSQFFSPPNFNFLTARNFIFKLQIFLPCTVSSTKLNRKAFFRS